MVVVAFLTVLVAALAWLWHRLTWAPAWGSRVVPVVAAVVMLALTGLAFLQFGAGPTLVSADHARPVLWVGATWLALVLYLVLAAVPVAVVSWLTGLSPRTDRRALRIRIHRIGVPLAVLVALIATGAGVREAGQVRLSARTVTTPDLPAGFDGLTVAVLTDLHVGPVKGPGFTTQVVSAINGAKPDLVLIAGDLVDGPEWRYGPAVNPLADLRAPLGVFAVTGNHETYTGTVSAWERRLKSLGVRMIDNTRVSVLKGDERIWVLGVRDFNATGAMAPNYERPLARVSTADFALLLAHQPRSALKFQGGLVDLQVSGHTHGGQLWPFRKLVLLQQPVIDGSQPVGDVDVLTSRGAGTWGPPVRLGAPPEIPLITLRRG